jgi:hypothetical protein
MGRLTSTMQYWELQDLENFPGALVYGQHGESRMCDDQQDAGTTRHGSELFSNKFCTHEQSTTRPFISCPTKGHTLLPMHIRLLIQILNCNHTKPPVCSGSEPDFSNTIWCTPHSPSVIVFQN